jgi:hypothetical protein
MRYITKNGTNGVTDGQAGDNSNVHYVARMALTTLVLATTMSIAATGRLTGALLLSGLACWWFLPVLQLLTGLLMIQGGGLERRDALNGYFETYRPWSLWLLIMAATVLLLPNPGAATYPLALTAAVPAALTVRGLLRFSRERLGDSPVRSWQRVALHQAATGVVLVAYMDLSVALWPRVLGVLGR